MWINAYTPWFNSWQNHLLCQSLTTLWMNIGSLFFMLLWFIEVWTHWFMHSSLKAPPLHFSPVEVWALIATPFSAVDLLLCLDLTIRPHVATQRSSWSTRWVQGVRVPGCETCPNHHPSGVCANVLFGFLQMSLLWSHRPEGHCSCGLFRSVFANLSSAAMPVGNFPNKPNCTVINY